MPNPVVTCNAQLQKQCNDTHDYLHNSANTLRLFSNNRAPLPGDAPSAFVECNFSGYVSKPTNGQMQVVVKVQDGQYQTAMLAQTWTAPPAGSQTIYGWYILDPTGANVLFAQLLDTPFTITAGGAGFVLQLNFEVVAWRVIL